MSSEGVFLQGQCQYPSDRVTTTRPLARHTPRCRRSWGLPRGWLSGNQTRGNATTLVSPVFPCFHQWLEERTWGGVPCGEQAQSLPKIWNQMTATGALEEPGLPSGKPGCPARLETWQGCRIQQQRSSRLIPAPSAHAWGAPLYFSTPARPPPQPLYPSLALRKCSLVGGPCVLAPHGRISVCGGPGSRYKQLHSWHPCRAPGNLPGSQAGSRTGAASSQEGLAAVLYGTFQWRVCHIHYL